MALEEHFPDHQLHQLGNDLIVIVIHEKLAPLQQSRTYLPQIAAGLPGCSCSEVS